MGLQEVYKYLNNKTGNLLNFLYNVGNPQINQNNQLFIDNKPVEYGFEKYTLRFKYLFNQATDFLGERLFRRLKITWLQTKIYNIFVKTVAFDYKGADGSFETFELFKNCCAAELPVNENKGAAKWHAYYFIDNLCLSAIHTFTNSNILAMLFSSIMQGYDQCPNQEQLFGSNTYDIGYRRNLSYIIGALNGLMCVTAHAYLSSLIGMVIPNRFIGAVVTTLLWAPISSAVMCKIEYLAKNGMDSINRAIECGQDIQSSVKAMIKEMEEFRSKILPEIAPTNTKIEHNFNG